MIFVSLHLCPKCQTQLTWDSVKHWLTCGCGSTYSSFVNMANFKEAN